MNAAELRHSQEMARRLSEAEAVIDALLSGQIDAVVDSKSRTPVLLSKAQDALRESEERYRRIVETSNEGICTIDAESKITFVNRRLAEMFGYSSDEMLGTSLLQFAPDATRASAAMRVERWRQGVYEEHEAAFVRKDGSELWALLKTSPIRDTDGSNVGTLAMMTDRTRHKEAEVALRKSEEQLIVSDRMASVGTLAAGVAHEINNPLAAVIGNLEFITDGLERLSASGSAPASSGRSDALQKEIKESLDDAREAAERVRFIVGDLKIFSRAPNDEPRGAVDVKVIMESSLRMAWNEIRHRAHVVKNYGPVPCVEGNQARLGQVFLNLLVNAAQAMQEGRAEHNEVRVSTRLEGQRVVVEVSDTGAGIPPAVIGRIFDAFFTTKAVGVGTGLGLAICQRIVTDMGGELTVHSEVGKGTTFRVALPIAQKEETDLAPAGPPSPLAGRRGRILVVDDEPAVVGIVKRILSKEHDVVAVVTAKEALTLCARGERFDLILSDLMMPEMTGMDLHRELSRIDPEQAERMIFLTGGAFTPKARRFLSETPQEHLEKPFDSAHLRASVQRYVR